MENFEWHIQNKKQDSKRKCGETDSGRATGMLLGSKGYRNMGSNSTRQYRLEWQC
tara:strand:- start:318 stop:482 length:165 start_codon:yes stop_codon:yes gene_type:complete